DSDFEDAGDGMVRHKPSGLVWKRCAEGQEWNGTTCNGAPDTYSWTQAFAQAVAVNAAQAGTQNLGQTDWRVPNINELKSIVEEGCHGPAINTKQFPAAPSGDFVSSSPVVGKAGMSWGMSFHDGFGAHSDRGDPQLLRLVRAGQAFLDFDAKAVAPVLSGTALAGTVGQDYSFTPDLNAEATKPVQFSLASGTLPAGLNLNADTGAITGKPEAAGSTNVTLKALNVAGEHSLALTIEIKPAPVKPELSGTAPAGTVGQAYSFTPTLNDDATKPVKFSLANGALPAGLKLNADTGAIEGTPEVAGSTNVTLKAVSDAGEGTLALTIKIDPAPVKPELSGAAPAGTVGQAYSFTPTLNDDATQPVQFSLANGTALPAGLKLNAATGAITGQPTQAGSTNVTLKAKNEAGEHTLDLTIKINPAPVKPALSGAAPEGTVGQDYSFTPDLNAEATKPVSFSLASGTLPTGLKLDEQTGAITGQPTKAGSFKLTLQAKNSAGTSTLDLTIEIKPAPVAPEFSATGPAGNTVPAGTVGVAYNFMPVLNADVSKPVRFEVVTGALPAGLVLDVATGAITGQPTQAGSFELVLRASNSAGEDRLTVRMLIAPASGGAGVAAVPTLNGWGLALLSALAAGLGLGRTRRSAGR
ncbi:MAG: IPTL-CTERM sorting domain-containing protein, partial [Comamonadaceae bacterium]|nr:IPTL-CTERM sorting domain-containing protein [Comamonadaceae bacterium]